MSEISIYQDNLISFLNIIEGSQIEKILFTEDLYPTFDKIKIQYKFRYCFNVTFITNKGNYLLTTSQTSSGIEKFWVKHQNSTTDNTSEIVINSFVKNVSNIKEIKNHPYKFSIFLESGFLTFYAADIYDGQNSINSINLEDEMILVFDNEIDLFDFEKSIM